MRKWTSIVAVAALATAAAHRTADSKDKKAEKAGQHASHAAAREFTLVNLEYKDTKVWVPGTLIVRKGEKVRIKLINETPSGRHGFAIHDFGVETEVHNGAPQTVEFTADKAGLFPIHCHLHPAHIGGQLLVLEK